MDAAGSRARRWPLSVPDDRLTVGAFPFLDPMGAEDLPGQISDVTMDSYADTVRLHLEPACSVARCCAS